MLPIGFLNPDESLVDNICKVIEFFKEDEREKYEKFCECGDSTENKPRCDTCRMLDEDYLKGTGKAEELQRILKIIDANLEQEHQYLKNYQKILNEELADKEETKHMIETIQIKIDLLEDLKEKLGDKT